MDAIADKTFTTETRTRRTHDDSPSLLSIIIDTNSSSWHKIREKASIKSVLESLLIGINAHLALNNSNKVSIIASHTNGARFLYPLPEDETPVINNRNREASAESRSTSPEVAHSAGNTGSGPAFVSEKMYRTFRLVDEAFLSKIIELIAEEPVGKVNKNHLSSSISLSLTQINKTQQLNPQYKARILILNLSEDEHLNYIPIMNCIFSAQKLKISIDVVQFEQDSTFLQQAADGTNGVYILVENLEGLVQYFSTALFIDPSLRNILIKPTTGNIDFRASCFVTGKVVDVGYVCSVCLCILSMIPDSNKCPACDSPFDNHVIMKLKRKPVLIKPKKKKKRKLNNGSGANTGSPTPASTAAPTPAQ